MQNGKIAVGLDPDRVQEPLVLPLCPLQPVLLTYLRAFMIVHQPTEQLRDLQLLQLAGTQTNDLYSPPHPQFQALQTYS